jgi:hypothetical protein
MRSLNTPSVRGRPPRAETTPRPPAGLEGIIRRELYLTIESPISFQEYNISFHREHESLGSSVDITRRPENHTAIIKYNIIHSHTMTFLFTINLKQLRPLNSAEHG